MIIIRLANADKWLGNRHTLGPSLPSGTVPAGAACIVSQSLFQTQARKTLCLLNPTIGCTRSRQILL